MSIAGSSDWANVRTVKVGDGVAKAIAEWTASAGARALRDAATSERDAKGAAAKESRGGKHRRGVEEREDRKRSNDQQQQKWDVGDEPRDLRHEDTSEDPFDLSAHSAAIGERDLDVARLQHENDRLRERLAELERVVVEEREAKAKLAHELEEVKRGAERSSAPKVDLSEHGLDEASIQELVAKEDHLVVRQRFAAARQALGLDDLQPAFAAYQIAIGAVGDETSPRWSLEFKRQCVTLLNSLASALGALLSDGMGGVGKLDRTGPSHTLRLQAQAGKTTGEKRRNHLQGQHLGLLKLCVQEETRPRR